MRLLLSNDDGVDSPALGALAEALSPLGELVIVAPDRERSGSSHAFTHQNSLRFRQLSLPGGRAAYAVDGTPVDCVKVGLFLSSGEVDWVVSGLNLGANVGVDAFYSGTVGAACEGALQGCRGIAFSLELRANVPTDLEAGARLCRRVFDQVLARGLGRGTCLNVNVPACHPEQIHGVWPSTQAMQRYLPRYEWGPSQNGWRVLNKEGKRVLGDASDQVDYARLRQGWITVTPLSLDRTDQPLVEVMRAWSWTL